MDTLYRDIQRTLLWKDPKRVGNATQSLYTPDGLSKIASLTKRALYWKDDFSHIDNAEWFAHYTGFPIKEFVLKTRYLLDTYIKERISYKRHFEIERAKFCMTVCILTAVVRCLRSARIRGGFYYKIDGINHYLDCSNISVLTNSIQFSIGFDENENGNKYTDYYANDVRSSIKKALTDCKKMGIPMTCTAERGYYVFTISPLRVMGRYLDELKQEIYVKEHPEEFEDFDFSDPLAGLDKWSERNRRG